MHHPHIKTQLQGKRCFTGNKKDKNMLMQYWYEEAKYSMHRWRSAILNLLISSFLEPNIPDVSIRNTIKPIIPA